MKCLRKYEWVKLPRNYPDMGKGLMAYWAKLASRAAFRKGEAKYCGHINAVTPGMWAGGIVGLKSILGVKSRSAALEVLNQLGSMGYIKYGIDPKTRKLTYEIKDWVVKCSGAECLTGTVYATDGYGFLCLPRNITERLFEQGRTFDESDAWLDLWCHTAFEDRGNAFSFLAPVVQYGKYGTVLTLETLGQRWGWEKTKVWRFFKKHGDVFSLHRLPSSYGCLIFNTRYPTGTDYQVPESADVVSILNDILTTASCKYTEGSPNECLNRLVCWFSAKVISARREQSAPATQEHRVAHFAPLTRVYFSHGRNCKSCRNCIYDCPGMLLKPQIVFPPGRQIRGPCEYEKEQTKYQNN